LLTYSITLGIGSPTVVRGPGQQRLRARGRHHKGRHFKGAEIMQIRELLLQRVERRRLNQREEGGPILMRLLGSESNRNLHLDGFGSASWLKPFSWCLISLLMLTS
jgi:hypothetical protein